MLNALDLNADINQSSSLLRFSIVGGNGMLVGFSGTNVRGTHFHSSFSIAWLSDFAAALEEVM